MRVPRMVFGIALAAGAGLAPGVGHGATVTIHNRQIDPGELFADSSTVPERPLPRGRTVLGLPALVIEGTYGPYRIGRCSGCPGPARIVIDDGTITGVHRLVITDARIRVKGDASPRQLAGGLVMEVANVFPGLSAGTYPHGVTMDGVYACRGTDRCLSPIGNAIEVSGFAGDSNVGPLELIKAVGNAPPSLAFTASAATRRFAQETTKGIPCSDGSGCSPLGRLEVRISLTEPGDALNVPGSIVLHAAQEEGAAGDAKLSASIAVALAPLAGGDCGGPVPCACGDTLVASRTLVRAIDPVLRGECLGNGLTIGASNVTLHLGCAGIRGVGDGVGILIAPGITGVTVTTGSVAGFATGIAAADTASTTVTAIRVTANGDAGIDLAGPGNRVEGVVASDNGTGVRLDGDGNVVEGTRALRNDTAVAITGSLAAVSRSVVRWSTGPGMVLDGAGALIESNHFLENGGAGLAITGTGHAATGNVFKLNGGDGLSVPAGGGMSFTANRSDRNGGHAIADATVGGGTAGTANTYTANLCLRDAAGPSAPAGLCF